MKTLPVMLVAVIGLAACGTNPLEVRGSSSRVLTLQVGQELDQTLGTLGPGYYQNPTISSASVQFLGDSIVPPYTPGGPTQRFRFRGASVGQAVIVITHSGNEPTITDTVVVR